MSAGFGFSASDFIAAIDPITKVGRAVKETGGASGDYGRLLSGSKLLERVLTEGSPTIPPPSTSASSPSSPTSTQAEYEQSIQEQAKHTLKIAVAFLSTLSKFETSLGSVSPWHHSVLRRAQWATVYGVDQKGERFKGPGGNTVSNFATDFESRLGTIVRTSEEDVSNITSTTLTELQTARNELKSIATDINRHFHQQDLTANSQAQCIMPLPGKLTRGVSSIQLQHSSTNHLFETLQDHLEQSRHTTAKVVDLQ